jgi:prevent-host-death family protein
MEANVKYASVRDLKNRTSAVVRETARGDVVVTSRGKPVALLQRLDEEDLEDYVFYSAPAVRREIERRWEAYRRSGKSVPLSKVRLARRRRHV